MHKPAPLIKKGDDPRRDWQRINQDSKAIGDLQREVAVLRQERRDAGGGFEITREPFQIYNTPNTLRQLDEREDDAWRKFKVRAGFIDMVPCAKTDDADGTGQTPDEIEVPDGTPAYYVWADLDAKEIKHGAELPAYTATIRPLAKIDTYTYSARKRVVIRQYCTGDIFKSGGATKSIWRP